MAAGAKAEAAYRKAKAALGLAYMQGRNGDPLSGDALLGVRLMEKVDMADYRGSGMDLFTYAHGRGAAGLPLEPADG